MTRRTRWAAAIVNALAWPFATALERIDTALADALNPKGEE